MPRLKPIYRDVVARWSWWLEQTIPILGAASMISPPISVTRANTMKRRRCFAGCWRSWTRDGHEHADTATVLNNLGVDLDSQSRFAEAEALYRRSLMIREAQAPEIS